MDNKHKILETIFLKKLENMKNRQIRKFTLEKNIFRRGKHCEFEAL